MVYARDLWIQLPTRDIYNTLMMLAAVNAARDMYEKGQQEMKDFKKDYGDFFSPISRDMDWYNENVTGRVQDVVNDLYANGIDPLRSAEGRAAISRVINSINPADINKLKQSAAIAQQYIAAAGKMGDKYNRDFEKNYLHRDLDTWSTMEDDGIWDASAPTEFKTLKEATNDWYNDITPGMLNKEQVEAFDMEYDPRYVYVGIGDDALMDIAKKGTPSWQGSIYADLYRDIARKQVIARGDDPTIENIESQLQRNIADAQHGRLVKPTKKADEFAVMQQEQKNRVALENLRYSHDVAESRGGGGGHKEKVPVVFREAAARPGEEVGYDVYEDPHYQWMDPVISGARIVKGSKGNYGYNIPASQMNFIYRKGERNSDGTRISARWDYGFPSSDATFIQTGQIEMERDLYGNPHYYITGTLANNSTGREVIGTNGTRLYEMEVTERAYNYGKKQENAYKPDN